MMAINSKNRLNKSKKGKKRTKKPDCDKGQSCGYGCIERKDRCKSSSKKGSFLSNLVGHMIKIIERIKNPTKKQQQIPSNTFSGSPTNLQKAVNNAPKPKFAIISRGTPHYSSLEKAIKIPKKGLKDKKRLKSLINHEYGHHIDDVLGAKLKIPRGTASSSKKFIESRKRDEQKLLEKQKNTNEGYKQFFNKNTKAILQSSTMKKYLKNKNYKSGELTDAQKIKLGKKAFEVSLGNQKNMSQIFSSKFSSKSLEGKLIEGIKDEAVRKQLQKELIASDSSPDAKANLVEAYINATKGEDFDTIAQDMIGATTRNKVGRGHSDDYYSASPDLYQGAESFANINALYSLNSPLVNEYLKSTVPNQFENYLEYIDLLQK